MLLFASAEHLISLIDDHLGLARDAAQKAGHWLNKFDRVNKNQAVVVPPPAPKLDSRADLLRVASLRNSAAHPGIRHHLSEAQQAKTVVKSFLQKTVQDFWGEDLWTISVTELINDPWIKERIQKAEALLQGEDYEGAAAEAATAIENLLRLVSAGWNGIWEPRDIYHEVAEVHGPVGSSEKEERAFQAHYHGIQESIGDLYDRCHRQTLVQLADPSTFRRYLGMKIRVDGPIGRVEIEGPFFEANFGVSIDQDNAEFLVSFAWDLALEVQALGLPLTSAAPPSVGIKKIVMCAPPSFSRLQI